MGTLKSLQVLATYFAFNSLRLSVLAGALLIYPPAAASMPTQEAHNPEVRMRVAIAPSSSRYSHAIDDILSENDGQATLAQESTDAADEETQVLVVEVVVSGAENQPELEDVVYDAIATRPGQTTTRSQLQADINAIFNSGYFSNAQATPSDTPLGVRITFEVVPNPILQRVELINSRLQDQGRWLDYNGSRLSMQEVADSIFSAQYGSILNLQAFQNGVEQLYTVYLENGYVLAQVVDAPSPEDGIVRLDVAEGVVEDIEVVFLSEDGFAVDEAGNPIDGDTQEFIITRELETQPGDVFNQQQVVEELQRVSDLGIFEDVSVALNPGDHPRKVDVIVNVTEASTGSAEAGFTFSSLRGFSVTANYEDSNFNGLNQDLSASGDFGANSFILDTSLTSPGAVEGVRSLDSLSASGYEAFLPDASGDRIDPIPQLLEVLAMAEQSSRTAEAGLTLNNLGNLYVREGEYARAIAAYEQARDYFRQVQSPTLELLMGLRLATVYRLNGQPEAALPSYYSALEILQQIRGETRFERLLGQEVSDLFQTEWQLSGETLNDDLRLLPSLIELTVLLDIGATYSALGDYQQALYVVNSPELAASAQMMGRESQIVLEDIQTLAEKFAADADATSAELQALVSDLEPLILESADSLKRELGEIIERSPELSRLLALQFIYADLNNPDLVSFYQDVTQQEFSNLSAYIQSGIFAFRDVLYDNLRAIDLVERLNIQDENLRGVANQALVFLERWLDSEWGNDGSDLTTSDEFNQELAAFADQLTTYLETSNIIDSLNLPSDDLENLKPIIESSIVFLFSALGSDENAAVIEFGEEILREWPSEIAIAQEYGWVRGFVFKVLADEYAKTGENDRAIAAYASAIILLEPGLEAIEEILESDALDTADSTLAEFGSLLAAELDRANVPPSTDTESLKELITSLSGSVRPLILNLFQSLLLHTHLNAADLYLETNQPQRAKLAYETVLSIYEKAKALDQTNPVPFGPLLQPSQVAEVYYGIAQADFARQDFPEAQHAIESAVEINETFFPKESLSGGTGFISTDFQYGYGAPNAGRLALRLSISPDNPWLTPPDLDDVSEDSFGEITSFGEPLRQSPNTVRQMSNDPLGTSHLPCSVPSAYFACRQKYFELYLAILRRQHQQSPTEGFDRLAFEQSERARTRSLQILQNLTDITPADELTPEEQRRLGRQLSLNEPTSFNAIQTQALDGDTLLLEYFLGDRTSYLWVMSRNGNLQTFELPPRDVIEAKAQEFYELLTVPSGRVRPRTTAAVGQELSEMILGAIADQLDGQRLLIVGDGFLQYLPFAALPDLNATPPTTDPDTEPIPEPNAEAPGEFTPHLVPLLLNHEIVMLPSASALVAIRQDQPNRPQASQELALFANPVFNHDDRRVSHLQIGDSETFQSFEQDQLETIDILYGALPGTAEELSVIGDETLIPPSQWQTFSGFDANLENALNQDLGQFRIVHFASHGIFNSDAPQRSGIVLSGVSEDGDLRAGLLSPAHAFNDMNLLGTELVVLSGCRTGIGRGDVSREGINGVTGGLLSAGTDRVVASLWSVQDEATRELMSRFYQRLLDPENAMTAAQALRSAQISMWEDPRWQTPYYWAAFIIQGEYR